MSLLIQNFRKEVAKHKDYRMKVEKEFEVGYPTGFLSFDFKNGAIIHVKTAERCFSYYSVGIVDGTLVTLIGRPGCGKTTFAMQAAANIVRPFENSCIFEDSIEGGLTDPRKETLTKFFGKELEDRCLSRNTGITAENFYERMKMIHDMKLENRSLYEYDTGLYDNKGNRIFKLQPTVYILDSWALLMPEKYTEEDDLSGQMAATATAKINGAILKRIVPMLKVANIILFIINHINQKVDINPMMKTKAQVAYLKTSETLPGGNACIYLSNNIIRFDDNSKLKAEDTFGIDGSLVDLGLVKSRTNKAGKFATLVFDQAKGFDPDLSLFILLKEHGRINGAGAYLYIGDRSDIKFSQKQFKSKLESNPELQEIFTNEVSNVLKTMITLEDQEERAKVSTFANSIMSMINSDIAA